MGLRMLMIDEVHNLLAGSYREQRRFLNMLWFLANDLCASLVVFGVNEALEAVRGDDQLARRLDERYLPLWRRVALNCEMRNPMTATAVLCP